MTLEQRINREVPILWIQFKLKAKEELTEAMEPNKDILHLYVWSRFFMLPVMIPWFLLLFISLSICGGFIMIIMGLFTLISGITNKEKDDVKESFQMMIMPILMPILWWMRYWYLGEYVAMGGID